MAQHYITDLSLQDVGTKSCPANGISEWRIVARFGREGKSDHARKSRIFNRLEPQLAGLQVSIPKSPLSFQVAYGHNH
jgi:hypothetical protein